MLWHLFQEGIFIEAGLGIPCERKGLAWAAKMLGRLAVLAARRDEVAA